MLTNITKMKIVGVKFTEGNRNAASYLKQYAYYTDDMSIKVDDYCVVLGASGAPSIVQVSDADLYTSSATKPILCKVDLDGYREKLRTVVARAAALKRLAEIDAEVSAVKRYAHLATHSDEARDLLNALDMLPGNSIEGTVE